MARVAQFGALLALTVTAGRQDSAAAAVFDVVMQRQRWLVIQFAGRLAAQMAFDAWLQDRGASALMLPAIRIGARTRLR